MVCYWASWAVYRDGYGNHTIGHIDPAYCTHLVYSFAGLNLGGGIDSLDLITDITMGKKINIFSTLGSKKASFLVLAKIKYSSGGANWIAFGKNVGCPYLGYMQLFTSMSIFGSDLFFIAFRRLQEICGIERAKSMPEDSHCFWWLERGLRKVLLCKIFLNLVRLRWENIRDFYYL